VKHTKTICARSVWFTFILILVAGTLGQPVSAQTAEKMPLPEYFGLYALDSGNLIAVHDGKSSYAPTTRSITLITEDYSSWRINIPELTLSVRFIVFDSAPSELVKHLTFYRLPYVRNIIEVFSQFEPSGQRAPVTHPGNNWSSIRVPTLQVKLLVKPIPAQAQMLEIVPEHPLESGIYGFDYTPGENESGGWEQHFVVDLSQVKTNQSGDCIDLVKVGGFTGPLVNTNLGGSFPLLRGGQYRTCDSVTSGPSAPITPSLTTPPAGSQPAVQPPSATACADYDPCFEGALGAIRSSDWQRAIANFEAAANQRPNSPDPWNALGLVYLGMGRHEEAPAMLDKGLSLGRVSLNVCHELTFRCQEGTFSLGSDEISFTRNSRKEFAVPPSKVTPVRVVEFRKAVGFRLSVEGKNYNFDFLPLGVTCDNSGIRPQCPEQGGAQQLAVANYVLATLPKLASGALGRSPAPPAPSTSPSNSPGSPGNSGSPTIGEIANVIAAPKTSPFSDQTFLSFVVAEAERAGVPLWLLLGQAKFETTFGDPINATVQDARTFTDRTTGNAHNLFNIRPGSTWSGKVLDTGRGGQFRVYESYEDSVRDYLRVVSIALYKGKGLEQFINTYFPASENGSARVEEYITSIIQIAGSLGFTVDRNTVPVP